MNKKYLKFDVQHIYSLIEKELVSYKLSKEQIDKAKFHIMYKLLDSREEFESIVVEIS